MPTTQTPTDSPPQDTRDKILEAAEVLFARSGFGSVGMRELASATGVSKSSLFHHFATKVDLYEEVLDRVLERVERALLTGREESVGPAERLDAWIRSVVNALAEDACAARLMMRALVEQEPFPPFILEDGEAREMMPSERRLAGIIERFRQVLEEGIETGVFRAVSVGDAIQTTIGAVVFHFASGEVGDAILGQSIFSAAAVERRRAEVSEFIRRGLLA